MAGTQQVSLPPAAFVQIERRRHIALHITAPTDIRALRDGAMLSPADAIDIHADTFELPPETDEITGR
jgi:hypothetical protein